MMGHNHCLRKFAYLILATGSLCVETVAAQTLPSPIAVITTLPPPAPQIAFSTSLRFGPDGLIYAWDGQQVWRQSGVNVDSFGDAAIGTVSTTGADAGPINFSQNGQTILVGNGYGGYSGSNGLLYAMPLSGGAATTPVGTVPNHFDLVPAPAASTMPSSGTKFIVDAGSADFATSEVEVFDYATGRPAIPLIQNIPGASSAIAFDSANRLYVGIGSGNQQGQIRRFTLPSLDLAVSSGLPLDWNQGQLFNSVNNNSGSGMLFDARGNLFVGGPDGVAVIDKNGAGQLYGTGPSSYAAVTYNPTNDQIVITPYGSNPSIYHSSSFNVPTSPSVTWNVDSGGNWSAAANWNAAAAPNGVDQAATLGGSIAGPVTAALDVPVTLGTLELNGPHSYRVSGPNALTMQVSGTIAAINVGSGSHEIAAPVVLTSSSDITVANSADTLTISGGISGSGMLSKEGKGTLAITGPNAYTGNTAIDAGRLRFQIASGSPAVAAGTVVTVAPGATLELAGPISAFGDASGDRAQIINDSTAPGLIVSGANQTVGAIDGGGSTTINAGGDLTADNIIQSALVIGGTAAESAKLTIAPSDSGMGLLGALAFPTPFGQGLDTFVPHLMQVNNNSSSPSLSAEGLPDAGKPDSVPEPSFLSFVVTAFLGFSAWQIRRRVWP
jgi:autotransporter-associated beta strand protein